MTTIAPVRRDIVVATTPLRAFEVFTDDLHLWWPFATHSVHGDGASAAFVDGQLIETAPDGSTCTWGTVLAWEPGVRLTMTWHPGNPEAESTDLTVRFLPHETGTRVELVHTGWERHALGEEAARNYGDGWPIVLRAFATLAGVA